MWRACGFNGPPLAGIETDAVKNAEVDQIPTALIVKPQTFNRSPWGATRSSVSGECKAKHSWLVVTRCHFGAGFHAILGPCPLPGVSTVALGDHLVTGRR